MIKLTTAIILVSYFVSSLDAYELVVKKLPDPCIEPAYTKANNCARQQSFKYVKETNTCVPVTDTHCRGHNRFTQSLECVYRCFDSSDFFKEVEEKTPEVLKPEPPKPATQPGEQKSDNRDDELHAACKDRKSNCWRSTDAYKFDAKTRKCVPVKDSKCRGANRFTMRQECEFVCLQNKGEVVNRKWQ